MCGKLANISLLQAGAGLAGLCIPLLSSWCLSTYGHQTTLRVWAIAFFVLLAPCLFVIKPRIPLSPDFERQRIDWSFIRQPIFIALEAGNLCQAMGFYIPATYLPSYVRDNGLANSAAQAALPVALLNSTSIIGVIALGAWTDHTHVTNVIGVSALGAALSVFVCWGFIQHSFPFLCLFAGMFGIFGGAYSVTFSAVVTAVRRQAPEADPAIVFAFVVAARGLGCVVCGPISALLVKSAGWEGYGGPGYGALIIFTGATAALSGVGWMARRAGLI